MKAVTDAKKAWAKKSAIEKKKEKEKRKAQAKAWRKKHLELLKAKAVKEVNGDIDELKKRVAAARKRARDKAAAAALSAKRLTRAKVVEGEMA